MGSGMPSENDPIEDDEYVYRRVLHTWCDLNSELLAHRIDRQVFHPTDKDKEGISLYRALFVTPVQVARDREGNLGRYFVVRLSVAQVRALGLSLKPDPQDGLRGHSLMSEIRHGLKGEEKKRAKELQLRLAELASADIVFVPPP